MFKHTIFGLKVKKLLEESELSDWTLTSVALGHKTAKNVVLNVGYGWWKFDLHDKDPYTTNFSWYDRWKLWPLAREIRDELIYEEIFGLKVTDK